MAALQQPGMKCLAAIHGKRCNGRQATPLQHSLGALRLPQRSVRPPASAGHRWRGVVRAAAPAIPSTSSLKQHLHTYFATDHATDGLSLWLKDSGFRTPDLLVKVLPPSTHEFIHAAEDEIYIVTREIIIMALVMTALKFTKTALEGAHWIWKNTRKDPSKATPYELSLFWAAEEPIKASIILVETAHLAVVIANLLNNPLRCATVYSASRAGFVIIATWFALRWKDTIIQRLVAATTSKSTKDRLISIDKLVSLAMAVVGVMVACEVSGVAFKSLLAVGGASGIALGLAARDVIGNVFGGTMLFLNRPFSVDDVIKAGSNVSGKVLKIGFYSTTMLSSDQQPMYIPNAYFTNQVIINLSRQQNRVFDATFALKHSDLTHVGDVVDSLSRYLSSHPAFEGMSKPSVLVTNLSTLSLDLQMRGTCKPMGGDEFSKSKHEILLRTAKIIEENGASLNVFSSAAPVPALMMAK